MKIYESQSIVASKSDLMRAILLYNYGGAWMDSDVLLVQNLAPMLEEDWAVLMYADFVNQAALLRKVRDCEGYHGMVIKPHKFNKSGYNLSHSGYISTYT